MSRSAHLDLAEVNKTSHFCKESKPFDTKSFQTSGLKQPDGMQTTAFLAILTFQAPTPIDINVGVGSTDVNMSGIMKNKYRIFR